MHSRASHELYLLQGRTSHRFRYLSKPVAIRYIFDKRLPSASRIFNRYPSLSFQKMRRGIKKTTKKNPRRTFNIGNIRPYVERRDHPGERTTSSINFPLTVGEAQSERNSESGSPAPVADADLRSPEYVSAPQSTCNGKPGSSNYDDNMENFPPRGEPKVHACLIPNRHLTPTSSSNLDVEATT